MITLKNSSCQLQIFLIYFTTGTMFTSACGLYIHVYQRESVVRLTYSVVGLAHQTPRADIQKHRPDHHHVQKKLLACDNLADRAREKVRIQLSFNKVYFNFSNAKMSNSTTFHNLLIVYLSSIKKSRVQYRPQRDLILYIS